MPSQTQAGKAFEYALIHEADQIITLSQKTNLINDIFYSTAKNCFELFNSLQQSRYSKAAIAALNHIIQLEPKLTTPLSTNDILQLQLMPDNAGIYGDVRDILFIRSFQNWQIGISAKNNHKAIKHSRLSDIKDFGKSWIGYPCSQSYFDSIAPVFSQLRKLQLLDTKWNSLPNKHNTYYVPVLNAFKDELLRLNNNYPDVPGKLVAYLLGKMDFYKVIKRARKIEILGFNINGTLSKSISGKRAITTVSKLQLPSQIIQFAYKPGSTDTLLLVCDRGWQISFRIHNAETFVVPSLKFDINLLSHPESIYSNHIPY